MYETSLKKQTRIDDFFRIISTNNTLIKLSSIKHKEKKNRKPCTKKQINKSIGNQEFIKSEIEILQEITPSKHRDHNITMHKRSISESESNKSSKRHKLDVVLNTNNLTNETPRRKSIKTIPNEKKSKLSPKRNNYLPDKNKISPRKLFFSNKINIETLLQAIENLNLVRLSSISLNEFNLKTIYQNQTFSMCYKDPDKSDIIKFQLKDVVFPQEIHTEHLFMIVMEIFSNPINCGYFLKTELNRIFSLFTLTPESQMLFIRLLKRKLTLRRIDSIKYPEISNDLDPFFKELIEKGFCKSDLESVDISILLNILQTEEVKNICQKLKIDHRGNKAVLISRLIKYGNTSKSFFIGAKSPKSVLQSLTLSILKSCVCLHEDIINLFDRVITLFNPVQDPSESTADLFLTLSNVCKGEILYPPLLKNKSFPIFKNRSHLIGFVESKNALKKVLVAIDKKDWDTVRNLGRIALKHKLKATIKQEDSLIPLHIRKFEPEYLWIKILSKSIDAFKKSPETVPEAVNILKILLDEKKFSQNNQGRWYRELALIEMHHLKNLESSAALTLHALQQDCLTEVDVLDLLQRLRKLMKRKVGISNETKILIQEVQERLDKKGSFSQLTDTKTITASMMKRTEVGGKSIWSLHTNGNDKYYGSVEMLALHHYTSKDFHEGLHCEGSLPVTLFTIFFWDELYNTFVPGAFVSSYQDAPLDLFTADFFNNRKQSIENKIKFMRSLDLDTFASCMKEKYSNCIQYKSIIPNALFETEQIFKEVVMCLGINGVVGICERLVSNFNLWKSGFPDLIVWNKLIFKCKIVEVKGPNDFLSEKQRLWLQYLKQLGIEVEVCHVEAVGAGLK